MPLQPVPGVARLNFNATTFGTPMTNVIHVKGQTGTAFSQAQLDTLTGTLATQWATRFCPLLANTYTMTGVHAVDLTSPFGVESFAASSASGTASPGSALAGVACCISWKTAAHWRGGHGRTYLATPGGSNYLNGNTWLGTFVTAITAAAQAFLTDIAAISIGGSPAVMVIVRRQSGKTPLIPPIAQPVTSAVVDSRIDTMRHRYGKDR